MSLTVHVIGFQLKNFMWLGTQSILDVMCLAEKTGGLYITAETQEDLVKAFEKTLGCPMMSRLVQPLTPPARGPGGPAPDPDQKSL